MSAFAIKIIALLIMLTDHVGAAFPDIFPFTLRIVGRVSFPLFVYMVAEGCRHTRSMPRYLLRLAAFAALSEAPFDWALHGGDIDFLYGTNIFYTLCLGAAAVYAYQRLRARWPGYALYLSVMPFVAAMLLAEGLSTDYAAGGVAFIFIMYVTEKKNIRLVLMAACCVLLYADILRGVAGLFLPAFSGYTGLLGPENLALLGACLASVPIAAAYNGKRGPGMKWLFYAFYPAHLAILGVLRMFV